jgi:hypothetical protein
LQVQVSTNGSTWFPVSGSTTVTEDNTTNGGSLGGQPGLTGIRDNWTRELFDLTAYKGFATVSLRFRFVSDNDASAFAFELDDGFYIDNLRLIKSTVITPLAVTFVKFFGKLLPNNTVQLDWEAYTNQQHDYFEIQRSTDNNPVFIPIGRNGLPPYKAFDYNPEVGNNYYRLKQVNKDGTLSYSKTIKIVYTPSKLSVRIYPNPVKDNLTIKVSNSITTGDNLKCTISNSSGHKQYEQNTVINSGSSVINIDMSNVPSGLYILKITNNKNEIITVEKFVKQ